MKWLMIGSTLLMFVQACGQAGDTLNGENLTGREGFELIDSSTNTIASRFNPPEGFVRTTETDASFASYLRSLELKSMDAEVRLYNGKIKSSYGIYCSVVNLPIGSKDLHQCADAVMRLRAEYLWKNKRYDEIHFNFTNGFKADYKLWMQGKRIAVNGNKVSWVNGGTASSSYESFWAYLEKVFTYAGTLSLSKEMKSVPVSEMQIGDVFIRGGSPGHAVIVVDMVENPENGQKKFMLAQSYMPAQEIQILNNPTEDPNNPWYDLDFGNTLETPEWPFLPSELKRFP